MHTIYLSFFVLSKNVLNINTSSNEFIWKKKFNELNNRIRTLFFKMNLNENEMFKTFKTIFFFIFHFFLIKLKMKLNFRRRINCKKQQLQIERVIKKYWNWDWKTKSYKIIIKINYTIIFEIKETCLLNMSIYWLCIWKLNKYKNAFFFSLSNTRIKKIKKTLTSRTT